MNIFVALGVLLFSLSTGNSFNYKEHNYSYYADVETTTYNSDYLISVFTGNNNYAGYYVMNNISLNGSYYYNNSQDYVFRVTEFNYMLDIHYQLEEWTSNEDYSLQVDFELPRGGLDLVYNTTFSSDNSSFITKFKLKSTLSGEIYEEFTILNQSDYFYDYDTWTWLSSDFYSYTVDTDLFYKDLELNLLSAGNLTYITGYNNGYNDGLVVGNSQSYSSGYNDGYNDGFNTDSTIGTVFSGILSIAMVPVNFFLSIFNFEILGINMASFVSALLTVAVVIIVIKMVSGKGKE